MRFSIAVVLVLGVAHIASAREACGVATPCEEDGDGEDGFFRWMCPEKYHLFGGKCFAFMENSNATAGIQASRDVCSMYGGELASAGEILRQHRQLVVGNKWAFVDAKCEWVEHTKSRYYVWNVAQYELVCEDGTISKAFVWQEDATPSPPCIVAGPGGWRLRACNSTQHALCTTHPRKVPVESVDVPEWKDTQYVPKETWEGMFDQLMTRPVHLFNSGEYGLVVDIENFEEMGVPHDDNTTSSTTEACGHGARISVRDAGSLMRIFNTRRSADVTVAVMGPFNVGKTFVVNELYGLGHGVSMGFMSHTRGISFVLPDDESRNKLAGAVLVDTAGTNQPATLHDVFDGKEQNRIMRSRKAADTFVQEVASDLATSIIIVVNRMDGDTQAYIQEIVARKLKLHEGVPADSAVENLYDHVIIVHNFRDTSTIQEVEKLIEQDIINSCPGAEALPGNGMNRWNHIAYTLSEEVQGQVSHYVLAREGTEAGDHYNPQTIAALRNMIRAQKQVGRASGTLLDKVVKSVQSVLPHYVHDGEPHRPLSQSMHVCSAADMDGEETRKEHELGAAGEGVQVARMFLPTKIEVRADLSIDGDFRRLTTAAWHPDSRQGIRDWTFTHPNLDAHPALVTSITIPQVHEMVVPELSSEASTCNASSTHRSTELALRCDTAQPHGRSCTVMARGRPALSIEVGKDDSHRQFVRVRGFRPPSDNGCGNSTMGTHKQQGYLCGDEDGCVKRLDSPAAWDSRDMLLNLAEFSYVQGDLVIAVPVGLKTVLMPLEPHEMVLENGGDAKVEDEAPTSVEMFGLPMSVETPTEAQLLALGAVIGSFFLGSAVTCVLGRCCRKKQASTADSATRSKAAAGAGAGSSAGAGAVAHSGGATGSRGARRPAGGAHAARTGSGPGTMRVSHAGVGFMATDSQAPSPLKPARTNTGAEGDCKAAPPYDSAGPMFTSDYIKLNDDEQHDADDHHSGLMSAHPTAGRSTYIADEPPTAVGHMTSDSNNGEEDGTT